jgi:uncharacterized membrane protein YiaA
MTTEQPDDAPDTGDTADTAESAAAHRRRTGRSIAAALIGIVAVIGLVGGALGLWTIQTAADSERFEAQVADLLQEEEISDALARRIIAELSETISLQATVQDAMPEILDPAIELLAAGVRSRLEDRLAEFVRTPEVAETVAGAAGRAHEFAVDVIEGDAAPDGILIEDDEVRINLLPLTARALTAMQEVGLLGDVVVPELERGGDPDEQRAELADALGRDLPDDFGTPVVFRSDSLDRAGDSVQLARDILVLAKRTAWFLLIGGAVLAGVSIWLSAHRLRSGAYLVAGLFGVALVVRLVAGRATERLPDAVEQPGAKRTIREVASGLESSLNNTMLGYAIIGLLALAVGAAAQFDLVGRLRRR